VRGGLKNGFVLQSESKERICAFAIKLKLATDIGSVVLNGPIVNGELVSNLFAGFAGAY